MASFAAGDWLWLDSTEDSWIPVRAVAAFKAGEAGQAEAEDGSAVSIDAKASSFCHLMDDQSLGELEDMTQFNDLSEGPLLHNLRKRYGKDGIYTWVGSILVAVNPFQVLPNCYTPENLARYVRSDGGKGLPPHCYSIASMAHTALVRDRRSQAICISGESGAGKTESMKLMLQFLAEASGRASGAAGKRPSVVGAGELSVEQQILQTNPVTEAFGNAKTLRNNNSSRFGKWTTLSFTPGGRITAAAITNYLLEKSRVSWQADGERGYHAFYQLLAHCHDDAALCADLRLGAAVCDDWRYVNMSSAHEVPGIDDKRDYDDVATALRALSFSHDEGLSVWKVVAGLLHVGNVAFAAGPKDEATVADAAPLDTGSAVLGLDAAALREGLVSKNIGTRSIIRTELSAAQADDARDAFAKAAFSRLFDFLILKINAALSGIGGGASGGLAVGVLDIFGFEFFEVNSFEQLCINYCNEKLQFHFNDHIFSQEAAEYTREGVDLAMVEFKNNGPTLELLEHKRSGVFAMLDEECVVPRGSDGGYLSKLFKAHEKHANFERCKPKEAQARTSFAVIHYAARVKYGTTGFLEKNRDRLLDGLVLCGGASTDAVVASLFAADAKELGSGKKSKKVKTLGANFRGQLRDLVDALNACEPHFVRCIKPNSVKQPRVFTAPMVQSQMRCAGVLEVCKIRRAGFPFRSKFADFERRYHYIDVAAKGCPSLVAGLEKQRILLSGEWALGKTKVFLRAAARDKLEAARERALEKIMLHAQACGRRYLARCRLCTWLRLTRKLAAAVASCDVEACEDALRDWYLLPHGGKHLAVYARGLAFKEESKALQAIIGECRSAMDRRDVAALDASVAKLKAAGNASLASVLEAAEALCHRLTHEPEVRAALVAAARAEDAAALKAALDEARAMGMAGPEVDAAAAAAAKVEERADVVSQLRALAAAGGASAKELGALLKRAQELDAPAADVAGAAALLASLQKQLEIVNRAPGALDRARDSRDLAELRALLRDAAAAGVPAADLRDCADFVAAVEREVEALAALDAATKQASSFSKPLETRRDGLAAALDGAAACESAAAADALEAASKILARLDEELACVRDVEAAVAGDGDLGDRIAALAAALEGAEEVYHGDPPPRVSAAAKTLAKWEGERATLERLAAEERDAEAKRQRLADLDAKLAAATSSDAAHDAAYAESLKRLLSAAADEGLASANATAAKSKLDYVLQKLAAAARCADALGAVEHGDAALAADELRAAERACLAAGFDGPELGDVRAALAACEDRGRGARPPLADAVVADADGDAASRAPSPRPSPAAAATRRSSPRPRPTGRRGTTRASLDRCEDLAHVVRRELAARRDLAEAADAATRIS
ncbi:myosin [Aureococcus anophagefferens]|uniref:Myosin n=1 Tax=Aureococcus anophagefferens TaxID=44056 RepID=A0ABR1FL84_AURAN